MGRQPSGDSRSGLSVDDRSKVEAELGQLVDVRRAMTAVHLSTASD